MDGLMFVSMPVRWLEAVVMSLFSKCYMIEFREFVCDDKTKFVDNEVMVLLFWRWSMHCDGGSLRSQHSQVIKK